MTLTIELIVLFIGIFIGGGIVCLVVSIWLRRFVQDVQETLDRINRSEAIRSANSQPFFFDDSPTIGG